MRHPCPCCGFLTFPHPSRREWACPVCGWVDVGEEDADADAANPVGLARARVNFRCLGCCHPRRRDLVRDPRDEEIPAE